MKVIIPIETENGVDSLLSEHFGSAPSFAVFDTETKAVQCVANANSHHEHGMCQPLQTIAQFAPKAIIVRGIGAGAFQKLNAAGIEVLITTEQKVVDVISAFERGALSKLNANSCCGHHHG